MITKIKAYWRAFLLNIQKLVCKYTQSTYILNPKEMSKILAQRLRKECERRSVYD